MRGEAGDGAHGDGTHGDGTHGDGDTQAGTGGTGTIHGIPLGMQVLIGTGIGVIHGGDTITTDLCIILHRQKARHMPDQDRKYITAREIRLLVTGMAIWPASLQVKDLQWATSLRAVLPEDLQIQDITRPILSSRGLSLRCSNKEDRHLKRARIPSTEGPNRRRKM